MIELPLVSLGGKTDEQLEAAERRSAASRARHALRKAEDRKLAEFRFTMGQISLARMTAYGLNDNPYRFMAATIFAYSPLESWLTQPDEEARLRRALAFCENAAIAAEQPGKAYPDVRLVFEETTLIGPQPSCLSASIGKNWGPLVAVEPLEEDGQPFESRIGIIYHANNRYNRRFLQRGRMRRMMPKGMGKVVMVAFRSTKREWLKEVTPAMTGVIRRKFKLTPEEFWRAAKGKLILDLPPELRQGDLFEKS